MKTEEFLKLPARTKRLELKAPEGMVDLSEAALSPEEARFRSKFNYWPDPVHKPPIGIPPFSSVTLRPKVNIGETTDPEILELVDEMNRMDIANEAEEAKL